MFTKVLNTSLINRNKSLQTEVKTEDNWTGPWNIYISVALSKDVNCCGKVLPKCNYVMAKLNCQFTTMYKPLVLFIETLITPDSCHVSGICERDHTISLQIFRSSQLRCSIKKRFLKISQNVQKNTSVGVSF